MTHKIGETFTMDGLSFEVIGFDYEGRIIAKRVEGKISTPKAIIEEEKPIQAEENTTEDYESMGIKELQALCKEKGLTIRGSKAEVIQRLKGAK